MFNVVCVGVGVRVDDDAMPHFPASTTHTPPPRRPPTSLEHVCSVLNRLLHAHTHALPPSPPIEAYAAMGAGDDDVDAASGDDILVGIDLRP